MLAGRGHNELTTLERAPSGTDVVGVYDRIKVDGRAFVDRHDRQVALRGVNVSGACKLPSSPWPACIDPEHPTFSSGEVSFVDRPFPRSEARQHWRRIREAGHNLIRLVVTWEAIEHSGPGIYDHAYLQYLYDVVAIAQDEGLLVLIDMHQDCWSRFSGGSGAPAWTFDVVGLELDAFSDTGAALVQPVALDAYAEPGTLWATNYTKFATNTMFTLFWAGQAYAPLANVLDPRPGRGTARINVGTLLQQCYVDSIRQIFAKLGPLTNVVGLDAMNEPHPGFIGLESMHSFEEGLYLHLGDMPSAAQSILLASGLQQSVPVYAKSWPWPTRHVRNRVITPSRPTGAWKPGRDDIWHAHSVYTLDTATGHPKLDTKYFKRHGDSVVDFADAFYLPFLKQSIQAARESSGRANLMLFVEAIPHSDITPLLYDMSAWDRSQPDCRTEDGGRIVAAPHWYDLRALFEKRFSAAITSLDVGALAKGSRNLLAHTYFGRTGVVQNYATQIARLVEPDAQVPVIIGETGIPMDMNGGYTSRALRATAHTSPRTEPAAGEVNEGYADRIVMLDAVISAIERMRHGYTLWNYTPENRAAGGGGDLWNGEDFSLVFRQSQVGEHTHRAEIADADQGVSHRYVLRATHGWVRPAVMRCPGRLIESRFCLWERRFVARWIYDTSSYRSHDAASRTAEIFVPDWLLRESTALQAMIRWRTQHEGHWTESCRVLSRDDMTDQSLRIEEGDGAAGRIDASLTIDFAQRQTGPTSWVKGSVAVATFCAVLALGLFRSS